MAFMIPTTLKNQDDTTRGERLLFDLFRRTLSDRCVVRYEMLLGERHYRPDFAIVDPERGILVVEVKDWGVSTISRATKEQFYVRYGRRAPSPQMNPNQKCQIYLRHTRENLAAMPVLRGSRGKLNVPIEYFVAFPNIRKQEFLDQGFSELIPVSRVLLKEDLGPKAFSDVYARTLPSLDAQLEKGQLDAIGAALFPNLRFALGTADGFIHQDGTTGEYVPLKPIHLSLEQERIAKSLGEGPRLLRGIAGTGKTLIMLYRAKLVAANNHKARILVLCWNTSLANYMRQAYDRLDFEAEGRVCIQHFSSFVWRLFSRKNLRAPGCDLDDPSFTQCFTSLHFSESEKYDAVYIDEAQDFRKEWIAFIFHNLVKGAPKERNLLIAADDAQRVYRGRDFSWASLDIPMIGRSKILKTVYRNSARVWVFSAFLLREKAAYLEENRERVDFSSKGGYDPVLLECDSLEKQIDKAVEIIQAFSKDGFAARNVLLLYRHKNVCGFPLIDVLRERFEEAGIPYDWIAEDARAKRGFDWQAETVKISTVHSAKGMDSPIVIVLGAETFDPRLSSEEYDETRLMYVALTRAREFLVVLHTGNGGLVTELRHCESEYKRLRDEIIDLEEPV